MNLSLSGGGARSAFQAGVIEALYEADLEYENVLAISGGVINGYFLKTGQVDFLREFWLEIIPAHANRFKWYRAIPWNIITGKKGLISSAFIMDMVKRYVREIPAGLSFDIVSMFDGDQKTVYCEDFNNLGQYQKAVYSSMAIPVLFPATDIEINSKTVMDCADGGLYWPLSQNTTTKDLKITTHYPEDDFSRVNGLLDMALKVTGYRRDRALADLAFEPNKLEPTQKLPGVWDWRKDSLLHSYFHGLSVGRIYVENLE